MLLQTDLFAGKCFIVIPFQVIKRVLYPVDEKLCEKSLLFWMKFIMKAKCPTR